MTGRRPLWVRVGGYLLLLWASLLAQTLPVGLPRPLGLLLAALAVACREEPLLALPYGCLCGLVWAGAAGRGPWGFCLPLSLLCLGGRGGTMGRFLLLVGAGCTGAAVWLTLLSGYSVWAQLPGALVLTAALSPLWYSAAQWINER